MNSELLYITRKLGYPSSFGTRAGLGDFLEQYPDGVYAENGGGAPMGWESAAVWFGGDSERAAAMFERMMSERNELSRVFRTRVAGVLVLTFIYRLKSRMVTAIPIIGGQPQPIDQTWLYFTMPEGGTVTLTKNGTPTEVTLEYSLDNGNTWTEWIENANVRSLTLVAGQTMHVRNSSETSTGLGTSRNDYYNFDFTTLVDAGGNVNSLLCKNSDNAIITQYCFMRLFQGANIRTAPDMPSTQLANECYYAMYFRSTLEVIGILPAINVPGYAYRLMLQRTNINSVELNAETLGNYACNEMLFNCNNCNKIIVKLNDISGSNCLLSWVSGVAATGDFYCPAELTIPTGANGIPSGWTRHDI